MNGKVYVRWYDKVEEGEIVSQSGLFGMVEVCISVQGVKVITLFHQKSIFNSLQEACGEYPKHFPTPAEMIHPLFPGEVAKVINEAVDEAKKIQEDDEYRALQQFKFEHWNHERNMLQLDYWKEYDKMFHAYMRKKLGFQQPQQEEKKFSEIIIPSSVKIDGDKFAKDWINSTSELKIEPRTIGKPYTVTELTLF